MALITAALIACSISACGPGSGFSAKSPSPNLPAPVREYQPDLVPPVESEDTVTDSAGAPRYSLEPAPNSMPTPAPQSTSVPAESTPTPKPTPQPMPSATPRATPRRTTPQPTGPCDDRKSSRSRASEVCTLVNRARAERGRAPLNLDSSLSSVALKYAVKMQRGNFFAHVAPDGSNLGSRLKEGKIAYRVAGENIAKGYRTSKDVVTGWLGSRGHRANIMESRFKRLGVGHAGDVWVQVFAD